MDAPGIPITFVHHAISVPVRVDDSIEARFILDTGIGLDLVSKSFCERLGGTTGGTHEGRRMSGQTVSVPVSRLRSLAVGSKRREDVRVGVFDMGGFPPEFDGIDGFLSLVFFEATPFTVDYDRGVVVLETETSLAARRACGTPVPVRIERDHGALELFLPMDVSVGEPAWLEVDTGSDGLILDVRYMRRLGIDPASPAVRVSRGRDETRHEVVRYFATMKAPIFPVAAPAMRQADAPVTFQEIIHDGLVGRSYLEGFVVTYDIPRSEIVLGKETPRRSRR